MRGSRIGSKYDRGGLIGFGRYNPYRLKMERNRLAVPREALGSGSVRLVDLDEAKKVLPELYERLRPLRPRPGAGCPRPERCP